MYVYLVVKTMHLYRTHPFILRTTIVALGSQGRNTETRLKQAAQIDGQFCTAVTGSFSRSNYHVTHLLLPEIRATRTNLKSVRMRTLLFSSSDRTYHYRASNLKSQCFCHLKGIFSFLMICFCIFPQSPQAHIQILGNLV